MNWTQPNPSRNNYWESDQYDFWVTSREVYTLATGLTRSRWYLFNGDQELGHYDTLKEAKDAADPAHGVNEDKEATPVCWWCGGTHPGQVCRNSGYYVEGS